ncbi:MAG: transporter, partial [Bacteroidales bacterium]
MVSLAGSAQEKRPELITDRPDQTESAVVVPLRSLQIETGFLMQKNETDLAVERLFAYTTTLLRYGLLERLELRIGLDLLSERLEIKHTDIKEHITGTGPLILQFKYRIAEERGWIPDIAFIGGATLPCVAKEFFRTSGVAPAFRFAFSHTLSDRLALGSNLGAEWDGESRTPGFYYSFVLGITATEKLGLFTEFYGLMREPGERMHLFDAGFTFLVLHNLQLDISGGIGLNKLAFD